MNFIYENINYKIDSSGIVPSGGDIDEINKTILIDRGIPEKFHQGIAVHEIEERKLLMKGHSYVYSHNEAQKKELEFYKKTCGEENALNLLEEEELVVLSVCSRRTTPKKSKIILTESENANQSPIKPIIEIKNIKEALFENKRYIIDNSEKLIGALVDVYEKGGIVYIDRDVPERFHESLTLNELVTRKNLKNGMGWTMAHLEGNKTEKEFLGIKYGPMDGQNIFNDEIKFQNWKYSNEKKELKEQGGHKVIYEKGEILSK
ncbi:MAG: hypothetical protein PHW15_01915 [Patescibacteria group bacterium]|jgi:hypothetical protein|nr:hypothetical protein [Patescibacteria group bacterium]MDD5172619.1 hypothetical protein [Patescibacteria group bacterium]